MSTFAPPGVTRFSEAALRRVRARYLRAIDMSGNVEVILEALADIPDLLLMIEEGRDGVTILSNEIMRLSPPSVRDTNHKAVRVVSDLRKRSRNNTGQRLKDWETESDTFAMSEA